MTNQPEQAADDNHVCKRCGHSAGEGCGCPRTARIDDRLEELAALRTGWLDGQGQTLAPLIIRTARDICVALRIYDTVLIAPTEEGGINLEWADRNGSHELEICPDLSTCLLTVADYAKGPK